MLSILHGREYNALNIIKESYPKFLRTYLRDVTIPSTNFVLTDFNHGVFMFPQREAVIPENTRKTIAFNNNIREFLIMTLTLLNFYKCFENNVYKGKEKVKELRNLALVNLCRIKKFYKNQFCHHFFSQHKILKKVIDKCASCNLSSSCELSSDS
jgi:hypothetical protein